MRNVVAVVMPPRSTTTIEIEPPMVATEQPFVLTVRGRDTAVVQVVDSAHVALTNPTNLIAPAVLFIDSGKLLRPAIWLRDLGRSFGGL